MQHSSLWMLANGCFLVGLPSKKEGSHGFGIQRVALGTKFYSLADKVAAAWYTHAVSSMPIHTEEGCQLDLTALQPLLLR